MIGMLLPSIECSTVQPITLAVGEIEDYDFTVSALQILQILGVLQALKLIKDGPLSTVEDVIRLIELLINDIDLESDEPQTSERHYVRVEYREEMLSLEVFIGV